MNSIHIPVEGRWRIIFYVGINALVILFLALAVFLLIPASMQKSLSLGLYLFAALSGVTIGSLTARVISLNNRLHKRIAEWERKHENIHSYIANVVHDLRSPAASVNMLAEVLDNELTEVKAPYREMIRSIRKTTLSMLDRICCILDNSRLERGIGIERLQSGNVFYSLIEVIKKHQILAIDKNLKIALNVPASIPNALFDKEALDTVLSNLLSNAIKYSRPNSTITIYHETEKEHIRFYVKDEGLGMSPDDLRKAFGSYTKLSARPTAGEASSGLGLSLVKKLVGEMDGEVRVTSAGKNKGSTFSFSLRTSGWVKAMTA
ncbi:MAG TPA: HAMP domain-containing sensor histidine kinase [Prolixibacteraceae bacterium]|nr:HAMP domain-containing sensor histidine kinase [Prolixibacteraceae bacterium]